VAHDAWGVTLDVAYDLSLEHGRCVIVRIPEGEAELAALADGALDAAERAHCAGFSFVRRRTWIAGRAAMREALTRAGLAAPAVLADPRGAPRLPPEIAGSISHKERLAAALVVPTSIWPGARIGVDLEDDVARTIDIGSRVLDDAELADVAALDPRLRDRAVLLRFSAKEAIYKGLDPFVRRFVGFKEVSLRIRNDGRADVTTRLPPTEGPFAIDVRWSCFDALILTTARVRLANRNPEGEKQGG
jgi:4'-phosphopantetheinyl transferase EntD